MTLCRISFNSFTQELYHIELTFLYSFLLLLWPQSPANCCEKYEGREGTPEEQAGRERQEAQTPWLFSYSAAPWTEQCLGIKSEAREAAKYILHQEFMDTSVAACCCCREHGVWGAALGCCYGGKHHHVVFMEFICPLMTPTIQQVYILCLGVSLDRKDLY